MTVMKQSFALPDVRCGGCILKIERTLADLPGVTQARGNATQKRMFVVWDEAVQTADSLRAAIQTLGYDAQPIASDQSASHKSAAPLLRRLGLAGFGMMNIMAFSLSSWFGDATDMGAGTMQFMHWMSAAIALPVVLYSGSVFHLPALRALRHRQMTMDTPISIAIIVTYIASLVETLNGATDVYFDAVVSLIFFLLIGRVLETIMHQRSGDAAENLRKFLRVEAHLLQADGTTTRLNTEALYPGDHVLIKAGDCVPADGLLRDQNVLVDESALTGEALPKQLYEGQRVAAGSILIGGPVRVEITHVGADTELGRMASLAEEVQAHKGRLQQLSDQFSRGYIPLVLGGGALGFVIWYLLLGASLGQSVLIAVAVLIVTCPCAAGLATPAVTSRAINLALSAGVVVKSGAALERLGRVDQVFLDKTGTASQLAAHLPQDIPIEARTAAEGLAAASHHPMARALLGATAVVPTSGAVEIPGKGVQGPDGARLGQATFVGAGHDPRAASLWFRDVQGSLWPATVEETPAPGLAAFLAHASNQKIPVSLLSGDRFAAVAGFAATVGLTDLHAEVSATEKASLVTAAQESGQNVLMIGDGINDSVALSAAALSASFAEATEIAQNTADVVLTQRDLSKVSEVMGMAQQARRLIHQNLTFSMVYNVVTIPLALAGVLTPAIAALLMSGSSIAVMVNGLRLRGVK